eukprot:s3680_g3.t1
MGTVGCCWRQRAALVVVKPPLELGADPQNEDVEGFCDMVQEKRGCDGNKSVLENMHSHLLRAAEIQCFGGSGVHENVPLPFAQSLKWPVHLPWTLRTTADEVLCAQWRRGRRANSSRARTPEMSCNLAENEDYAAAEAIAPSKSAAEDFWPVQLPPEDGLMQPQLAWAEGSLSQDETGKGSKAWSSLTSTSAQTPSSSRASPTSSSRADSDLDFGFSRSEGLDRLASQPGSALTACAVEQCEKAFEDFGILSDQFQSKLASALRFFRFFRERRRSI